MPIDDPDGGGAPQKHRGSIEVVVGGMFSGKTEELLRRLKRARFARQNVQCFKPRIDARYDASAIVSHDKQRSEAVALASSEGILREVLDSTQVVGIDEAQFFDVGVVEVAELLANRGVRVILAGLDQDYLGRPFAPMPDLMAIAESVTKLHAICVVCGETASRSQRIVTDAEQVLVGGEDSYEPRCRACFEAKPVLATRQRGLRDAAREQKRLRRGLLSGRRRKRRRRGAAMCRLERSSAT